MVHTTCQVPHNVLESSDMIMAENCCKWCKCSDSRADIGCIPSAAYISDPITSRYGYEETVECSSGDAGLKLAFAEGRVKMGMQSAMP